MNITEDDIVKIIQRYSLESIVCNDKIYILKDDIKIIVSEILKKANANDWEVIAGGKVEQTSKYYNDIADLLSGYADKNVEIAIREFK